MSIYLHGENGITFSFLNDLNSKSGMKGQKNLHNFLNNIRWIEESPIIANIIGKIQIHLFPSFGRGQWGMGEPDGMIITNNYVFILEVETTNIEKLPTNYYEQMDRFIQLGQFFEQSNRKKIGGHPIPIVDNKKVKGMYRTRKIIQEILKDPPKTFFYITITNNHLSKKINGEKPQSFFKSKVLPKLYSKENHGLFSLFSISKLNFVSDLTKHTIKLNIEK